MVPYGPHRRGHPRTHGVTRDSMRVNQEAEGGWETQTMPFTRGSHQKEPMRKGEQAEDWPVGIILPEVSDLPLSTNGLTLKALPYDNSGKDAL